MLVNTPYYRPRSAMRTRFPDYTGVPTVGLAGFSLKNLFKRPTVNVTKVAQKAKAVVKKGEKIVKKAKALVGGKSVPADSVAPDVATEPSAPASAGRPAWVVPAFLGGGVLAFVVARKIARG